MDMDFKDRINATTLKTKNQVYNEISSMLAIELSDHMNQECSICCEKMCEYKLKCGHFFHSDCLHKWIDSKAYLSYAAPDCPICRTPLLNERNKIVLSRHLNTCYTHLQKKLDEMYNNKHKIGVFYKCRNGDSDYDSDDSAETVD